MSVNSLALIDFLGFSACSRCGEPLKEIYERPEELTSSLNDFGLVVFKCEKYTLFHAFWIEPYAYDPTFSTPAKEDEHLGGMHASVLLEQN